MKNAYKYAALFVAVCALLTTGLWSQAPQRSITINADGTVTIKDAVIPLPAIMSEGSKKVLMRTHAERGPGSPRPGADQYHRYGRTAPGLQRELEAHG